MILNSTHDLAAWVLKAPTGAKNMSITTHMTGALPEAFGAFVQALDRERYITAFWRRVGDTDGLPVWRWELHRMKRRALRNNLADLLAQATRDAKSREDSSNDDD